MNSVKNIIFEWIRKHCSYITYLKIREKYRHLTTINGEVELYNAYVFSEKKTDKKYFILRMEYPIMGAIAVARGYLLMATWAEKNGYIPLVDWEYGSDLLAGKLNCNNFWNEIFVQPERIDEAVKEGTVIVGTINKVDGYDNELLKQMNYGLDSEMILLCSGDEGKKYYAQWEELVKKYWKIQPQLVYEFERGYQWLFDGKQNVLGVMVREEFCWDRRKNVQSEKHRQVLEYHPEVPSLEETLRLVDDYFEKWKCEYIFLSTVEQRTIEEFQKRFGEKVVFIKRKRVSKSDMEFKKDAFDMTDNELREEFPFSKINEQNRTYIQELYGLSRCNFLIGPACGGMQAALLLNGGKYEDTYIFSDYNKNSLYLQK